MNKNNDLSETNDNTAKLETDDDSDSSKSAEEPKTKQREIPEIPVMVPEKSQSFPWFKWLLILLTVSGFYFYSKDPRFQDFVDDLREKLFANQHGGEKHNFTELQAVLSPYESHIPPIGTKILKRITRKANVNSGAPLALLLMSSTAQQSVLDGLTEDIGTFFDSNKQIVGLENMASPDDIEKAYKEAFEKKKLEVMIMKNLELLQPSLAMTFHQFINDVDSKVVPSFVILSLKYNENLLVNRNATYRQFQTISSKVLHDLWSNTYYDDQLESLQGRIAENTIVLINSL